MESAKIDPYPIKFEQFDFNQKHMNFTSNLFSLENSVK